VTAVAEPIEVPVTALRTHAVSLDRIADQAETSRSAASVTHLDRGAYGQLCQFMPEYFEPGMQDTVDGLATSVAELHRLAQSLRTAAGLYAGSNEAATLTPTTLRLPL
jgi:Excreted virulence factor EspC, type VII ESX diderm